MMQVNGNETLSFIKNKKKIVENSLAFQNSFLIIFRLAQL